MHNRKQEVVERSVSRGDPGEGPGFKSSNLHSVLCVSWGTNAFTNFLKGCEKWGRRRDALGNMLRGHYHVIINKGTKGRTIKLSSMTNGF